MGIVRNFIDIIGITPEYELPSENKGQMLAFSEVENIFLPEEKGEIDSIFQIIIDLEIKSTRTINTPLGRMQVLDGLKKFKIIYSGKEKEGQISIMNLSMPFNTFIDLPDNTESENIKVFILDAYFELVDPKKIYGHFLYMIDVHYNNAIAQKEKLSTSVQKEKYNTNKILDINNFKVSEINKEEKPVKRSFKINEISKEEKSLNRSFLLEEVSISSEEKKDIIPGQIEYKNVSSAVDEDNCMDIDSEYL